MRKPDDTRLRALMHVYLQAHYRCRTPDGTWLPLRVGQPAPALEAALTGSLRFGLLSACNPCSRLQSEAVNRRQQALLHEELLAAGVRPLSALACAPDGSWPEPGWLAAGIDAPTLDALARRHGQLGSLYWERGQPVRLRMDAPKPARTPPQPGVDWLQ